MELRNECGSCGETKACVKKTAAGEQQVLRSTSARVLHGWTLAEVCASREFSRGVGKRNVDTFLGVRWYSFRHDKFDYKDRGCLGVGVCDGSVALRGSELFIDGYGEPD